MREPVDEPARSNDQPNFEDAHRAARSNRRQVSSEQRPPSSRSGWDMPFTDSIPDPTDLFRTMFETWFSMAEAVMANTWGIAKQTGQTVGAATRTTGTDGTDGNEALTVHVRAGEEDVGHLWLKNQSSSLLEQVQIRVTTPQTTQGDTLSTDCVRFDPSRLDRVIAGASHQIEVHVAVPADAVPGVYHALVLVEPLRDTSRPISIHVAEA